jgi:hypothetical protein
MLSIGVMRGLGLVKTWRMENHRERWLPFLSTTLLYATVTFMLYQQIRLVPVAVILGSITLTLALVTLLTPRWGISAHGAGIGGALGLVLAVFLKHEIALLFYPVLALLLLTGLLLSARLALDAHSPAQAWGGTALGFAISVATVYVLL